MSEKILNRTRGRIGLRASNDFAIGDDAAMFDMADDRRGRDSAVMKP